MKIKMLRNKLGSPDGFTTKHYAKGEVYEVPEGLGNVFMAEKDAEFVADEAEKAVEGAPKNKAE